MWGPGSPETPTPNVCLSRPGRVQDIHWKDNVISQLSVTVTKFLEKNQLEGRKVFFWLLGSDFSYAPVVRKDFTAVGAGGTEALNSRVLGSEEVDQEV